VSPHHPAHAVAHVRMASDAMEGIYRVHITAKSIAHPGEKVAPIISLPGVPIAPPGIDIRDNVRMAQEASEKIERMSSKEFYDEDPAPYDLNVGISAVASEIEKKYIWLNNHVKPGASMDYKNWHYDKYGNRMPKDKDEDSIPKYDPFGNFNFGAVAAVLGIPEQIATKGADIDHVIVHHHLPSSKDHGNDWIHKYYEWYYQHYKDDKIYR
jgi:hypothetical protein